MNKEHNEKLLNALAKNASMGIQSLEIIMPQIQEEDFKEYISMLNNEYNIILKEAQMLAKANDFELKLTNPIEKAELWTSIKLKTMFDKSTRQFATMTYLGTNMGIPDLIFAIADYGEASDEIIVLAKKLKELEEKSDETLKLFMAR